MTTKLTARAVDNLDLLHTIEATPDTSIAAVAAKLERDPANARKTIVALREEGFVEGDAVTLTDAGRAVTRLLGPGGDVLADDATLLLRHDQIEPDPDNARTDIDPFAINALAADILARSRPGRVGLLHALTVIPPAGPGQPWRLRGGYRRWRAIRNLIDRWHSSRGAEGLPEDAPIPCVRHEGVDGVEAVIMALVENVQREDLHPLDEGAAYARLMRDFGLSAEAIAAAVQKSKKHVADRVGIVEKLSDDAKRRMRLPADDPDHLHYAAARREMQQLNAKPKLAVDVDPKEALVLLEIAERCKRQPSHSALAQGRDGWTDVPGDPNDSVAAASLTKKGLIEFRVFSEDSLGPASCFVRIATEKAPDVRNWIADQGEPSMALWSARVAVVGAGLTGDLARDKSRYATPWLNPPPEPAAEPSDLPASTAAQPPRPEPQPPAGAFHSPSPPVTPQPPPPPAAAANPAPPATSEPEAQTSSDDPEIPDYLRRLASGGAAPEPRSAGAEAAPAPEPETLWPTLTEAQAIILANVVSKIASEPLAGRAGPDGKPAFVGCAVGAYHRDAKALELVTPLRLIAFVPSARDVQMCALTRHGQAYIAANPQPRHKPPYATEWLNPPKPPEAEQRASAPLSGERTPQAAGAASGAEPFVYIAKPCVYLTEGLICGHCDEAFELSSDFDDQAGPLDDIEHRYVSTEPGERCVCPNCNAPLAIARVEVRMVDPREAR